MTIKIIINVCLPSQCILSQQTVLTPFSLSSFLDKVIQKKSTNTLRSLDLGDLLILKNFICTKSLQPPLSLGVHRIVRYSCYYCTKALLTQVTPQS